MARVDDRAQLLARKEGARAVVLVDLPQRHFLDEADVEAVVAGKAHQIQHLVVVAPAHDHGVQLGTAEAGALGGGDPREHILKMPGARQLVKALRVQTVQAHVDAAYARIAQRRGHFGEPRAVGGERQLAQPRQSGDTLHQPEDVLSHQRLTTGEADLADA